MGRKNEMKSNAKTTMERILEMEDALARLEEKMPTMAYKYGKTCRPYIQQEISAQITERLFDILKDNDDRDIRIFHLMSQIDSIEKSVKDINKKFTAIKKQLKERKNEMP
jgi:flagellar capping protein FliD